MYAGVKYRKNTADGPVSGGPMYYMTKAFKERGLPPLGAFWHLSLFDLTIGAPWARKHFPSLTGTFAAVRIIGNYPVITGQNPFLPPVCFGHRGRKSIHRQRTERSYR